MVGCVENAGETSEFFQERGNVCEASGCAWQTGGDIRSVPEKGALFLCLRAEISPDSTMTPGKI